MQQNLVEMLIDKGLDGATIYSFMTKYDLGLFVPRNIESIEIEVKERKKRIEAALIEASFLRHYDKNLNYYSFLI